VSSSTKQYLVTTKHKGAVFCPLQTGLDLNALEWSPRTNHEERIRSSHIGRVAIGVPCEDGGSYWSRGKTKESDFPPREKFSKHKFTRE
jgi:hypothetical protein